MKRGRKVEKKPHLGIDEAGRGSAIGPLVVCGFSMQEGDLPLLASLPLADSKVLSPAVRERLAAALRQMPARIRLVKYPASRVDQAVARNGLNSLEISAMVGLIRGVKPIITYIDALTSNPRRFGMQVEALVAPLRAGIVAENKADTKYPLVQAASILAKVARDAVIAGLRVRYGDFGSGYPGDLKTRMFLTRFVEKNDFPRCVRRSWATISRLSSPEHS